MHGRARGDVTNHAVTRRFSDRLAAAVVAAAMLVAPFGMAFAADTPASTDLPDLAPIRAKVYAKDYQSAADDLRALTATVKHADLYNLLGFSLRNLGQYDEAAKWYREALYYDPDHRNAIEYQGELFIKTGQLQRAKNNVQKLEFLCLQGCLELTQLREAVAAAEKR
ncbi:tetratricopeptide repeat protein [Pigmentiphaga aceris]|uniref:Tetratricopeptide repeat protein n=2 Tax=Pigmentiphaga aceris TaxID=1940612 RepID=A0A5C0ARD1_9BURK|nr:tetratricopeptide repeat protein [Pigmentiphaga aceris]